MVAWKLLEPDFVTMLITVPPRVPYSAWKLLVSTETSWIDSRLGRHRRLGVAALIHDAAAIQIDLRLAAALAVDAKIGIPRGRVFAAIERVRELVGVAPGITLSRLIQLRPARGISDTCFACTVANRTAESLTKACSADAVTVTVSAAAPTSNVICPSATCWNPFTPRFSIRFSLNPTWVTVTV